MVIGSGLLPSGKIDPAARRDAALLDDILMFGVRLTWDQTHGGSAFTLIAAATQTVPEGLVTTPKRPVTLHCASFRRYSLRQPASLIW